MIIIDTEQRAFKVRGKAGIFKKDFKQLKEVLENGCETVYGI